MSNSTRPRAMTSSQSEQRFREIFFSQLLAAGYSEPEALRAIFKTPEPFHQPPSSAVGQALLEDFQAHYMGQLAHAWYFDGLAHSPTSRDAISEKSSKPVTFIVFPGIFGEFVDQLPFQSIVSNEASHFSKAWQERLNKSQDEFHQTTGEEARSCSLADVVKIGSVDEGDKSLLNVIVLKATTGSLETLGRLESNAKVFRRRLAKFFEIVDPDTDIYVVGYSRGLPVVLELISTMHKDKEQGLLSPGDKKWFAKLKGVVGLGGVYYGAMFASDVLNGKAGATSDLIDLLQETSKTLQLVPDDATAKQKKEFIGANSHVWLEFGKALAAAAKSKRSFTTEFLKANLQEVYQSELKTRVREHKLHPPSPLGIFSLVQSFLHRTFSPKHLLKHYNENILAFQQLVEALVDGLNTLTPESRDEWWRSHILPPDLVFFSLTGSMPDASLSGFRSPLRHFDGFGADTSDYNTALRSSYYSTIASESTMINDSQMSHFGSRYWEQMYPEHRYAHYYLGILGTHHWGMAFPFAVKDSSGDGNAFPRDIMLKSIAYFIASLES